jgi:hypothetical protein
VPPSPHPRTSFATAIITIGAAASAFGLLSAGCGGSSGGHVTQLGSTATHSSQQTGALAFSHCMRSHRLPSYPDPNSSGELVKETPEQLGVSSSQFLTARNACVHLLPGGGQPTRAELQQSWSDFLTFARCMRRHGVPNWPDPTRYPQHPERPTFELEPLGIDLNSPQINTRIHECEPLLHGNNPQHLGEGGS